MDTVQEFHLELLKNVQFENIRGVKIVADLLAHPGLWSAVFIEIKRRIESGEAPDQFWRLEALYLFTVPGREEELRSLAECWHPVEMHFTCEDDHWNETDKEPFTTNDLAQKVAEIIALPGEHGSGPVRRAAAGRAAGSG